MEELCVIINAATEKIINATAATEINYVAFVCLIVVFSLGMLFFYMLAKRFLPVDQVFPLFVSIIVGAIVTTILKLILQSFI